MIRKAWRAFWKGVQRGREQRAIEEALENLEKLKPKVARTNVLIAESEGRRHLEVVEDEDKDD